MVASSCHTSSGQSAHFRPPECVRRTDCSVLAPPFAADRSDRQSPDEGVSLMKRREFLEVVTVAGTPLAAGLFAPSSAAASAEQPPTQLPMPPEVTRGDMRYR